MTGSAIRPDGDGTERAAGGAPPRHPRPAGGRAGGSYSRFVGLMKVALPIAAAVLALMIVIWPQIEKESEGFRLGFSSITPEDVKGQRVVNARFNGLDSDGRPYTVTADSAVQADGGAEPVTLEFPKADIMLGGDAWLALAADTGIYRKPLQTLDLERNVTGFHDQGYEFRTSRAAIDLEAGTAAGDAPVVGHGPLGELQSQGFSLGDRGERIVFTGKSRLVIYPPEKERAPGKERAP